MRLIGEVEHPIYKISLFRLNERLAIKFEDGHFEQVYKVRESELVKDSQTLSTLITESFIAKAAAIFEQMKQNQSESIQAIIEKEKENLPFPTII